MSQQQMSLLATRRQLLAAGLFAGTALVLNDSAALTPEAMLPTEGAAAHASAPNAAFEHIVVLVMENRSFDQSSAGSTRTRGHAQDNDSRARGTILVQPVALRRRGASTPVRGHRGRRADQPHRERRRGLSPHTSQLWDLMIEMVSRRWMGSSPTTRNTCAAICTAIRPPRSTRQVMGGSAPMRCPFCPPSRSSFGIFDHWFSAVPSDTWPNRAFFHAATSNGFMSNSGSGGYGKWLNAPPAATVFTPCRTLACRGGCTTTLPKYLPDRDPRCALDPAVLAKQLPEHGTVPRRRPNR